MTCASDYFRAGTDDGAMWQDVFVRDEYQLASAGVDGMTVLDVGGGVGSFAAKALSHGASLVVSVEANRETCGVYRRVMRDAILGGRAVLVEGAAWSKPGSGTMRLYGGGVRSRDTLVFSPAGEDVGVKLLDFSALVRAFSPDAVKVDCEGSEYELFRNDRPLAVPPSVKRLWVEFHETLRQPWSGKTREALDNLRIAGWPNRCIKEINDTKLYELRR